MFRIALLSLALVLAMTVPVFASPSAHEFEFVGTAAECGGPAGAKIVVSQWTPGIGLPDNQGLNADPANNSNIRYGLLLVKNGLTSNCSSAGVSIVQFGTLVVQANTELGFDYLTQASHCGAGAPRFNISWTSGSASGTAFLGCSTGTQTPAPQDPAWTRMRNNVVTNSFPASGGPIPVGATITGLAIVFDEGTDQGTGLAALDNIFVNGKIFVNETTFVTPSP